MINVKLLNCVNHIEYQLHRCPETYEEALLHHGFNKTGEHYTKSYNKSTFMFDQDSHVLQRNFEGTIEEMLQHTQGTKIMNWEKSLESIAEIMLRNNIKWWLTGSAACAIRGIDIHPRDIDIMTYKTEIPKIEKAFKDFIIEPFHHVTDWVVKGFGVIYLHGRIDFAFEPEESCDAHGRVDFGNFAMDNLETVHWQGFSIKVPPVDLHIYPNKVRDRFDRVKLIEDYIKKILR